MLLLLIYAGDWFCTHRPCSCAQSLHQMACILHWHHGSSWKDSSDMCRVAIWSSCAWTSCMCCCFLSLRKYIFGKCPTFEQILHLCLLAGHLKLSLHLKSPDHVQSPIDLKFCLPFCLSMVDDSYCWVMMTTAAGLTGYIFGCLLAFGTSSESLVSTVGEVS